MPHLIDLSVPVEEGPSERVPVVIRRISHQQGGQEMRRIFGVPGWPEDGLGWASEELRLITHAGTHMDAPWHYSPTCAGAPARTIDQVPLEWCFAPGVVLDLRHKHDGEVITAGDLERAFERIDHMPRPGEIVLLMTGAANSWGTASYPERGAGLDGESTAWLCERGVRVIGTDAWGLDPPFSAMKTRFSESGDAKVIWSSHFAGRHLEYCQLEKLANLELLPSFGFTVICFPIKVSRASAGWTRVVAVLDTDTGER